MNQRIIAKTNEITVGKKIKVTIESKEILIVNIDGTLYAVDNKCTHMGGSLYDGDLDGYNVICPKHKTAYDLRTGKVSQQGKIAFLKINTSDINTYQVKIEGDNIILFD